MVKNGFREEAGSVMFPASLFFSLQQTNRNNYRQHIKNDFMFINSISNA